MTQFLYWNGKQAFLDGNTLEISSKADLEITDADLETIRVWLDSLKEQNLTVGCYYYSRGNLTLGPLKLLALEGDYAWVQPLGVRADDNSRHPITVPRDTLSEER